jgi:hypothetical protein
MASCSPVRHVPHNASSHTLAHSRVSRLHGLVLCLLALAAATMVSPFGNVAHAQLVPFPAALSVVPRLLLTSPVAGTDSTPPVVAGSALRVAYHDSLDEAAQRVNQALDRVFVRVSTNDVASGDASLLGASRNELGVAREHIRPLTEFEAAMVAAGALGVAVQLAVYLEPSGDADRASGPAPFAELVIVPGGMLAKAWF